MLGELGTGAATIGSQFAIAISGAPSIDGAIGGTDSDTIRSSISGPGAASRRLAGRGSAQSARQKAKTEPAKVYTDENISGLRSSRVSVVGDGNSGETPSAENRESGGESRGDRETSSGGNGEAYWRGKARRLLDQIAATDSEIKKLQEEIAKYGNVGFDPSTGLQKNVIYIEDRNANVKKLEGMKAELEKQMDTLQEEGRKAGAEPSWFR